MSEILVGREISRSGILKNVRETYVEPGGILGANERMVAQAVAVRTVWDAARLISAALAVGWRFRLLRYGILEMWAPAVWKPVTYTMENTVLWRVIQARGISLV